ncbi:PepSY-associated TM helix domain-containing protein [Sphingomonas morindae]|uniref:PepSY domain-containing protein n=1 Tax=Sphingomonas morindae TaxID=1541170 RepID=A0ABY4X7H2_9SPHN|nr:PepSY-associated TM helix domain-containing protein [Sphingomonas morindae]USI72882.1 PepSY domain-containing protein [Sphingomonas morindae]
MADSVAVRRLWWRLHQYLALAPIVLLIPLGLSGIVLTWDDAIDHVLEPQRYAVESIATLPPSNLAAAVAAAIPAGRVTMLRYPSGAGPAIASVVPATRPGGGGKPRVTVWLDPSNARVLDVARGNQSLVSVAHAFHGSLFVPGIGRALVGMLGIEMFLLAASGLWLWWPLSGSWRRALRWRREDKRLDTSLHHSAGFWIALPLAVQAFTGAAIAWPQMTAFIGISSASSLGGPGRVPPLAHPHLGPDEALAKARVIVPGGVRAIAWPSGREPRWRISLATLRGPVDVEVEDDTGEARRAQPRGGGFPQAARRWHQGDTLGTPWRFAMILIGLAPAVLGVTGTLMWWRGLGRRRRAAARARGMTEIAST